MAKDFAAKFIDMDDDSEKPVNMGSSVLFNPENNYFNVQQKIKIINILNEVSASLIDLGLLLKQWHWSLHGKGFIGIHENILDPAREHIDAGVDNIQEYIAFLGGQIKATKEDIQELSIIPQQDSSIGYTTNVIQVAFDVYIQIDQYLRKQIKTLDSLGDDVISNVLQDICRSINSDAWKLNSELRPPMPDDMGKQVFKTEQKEFSVYTI